MAKDLENEIRLKFLDEAQEYLDEMEIRLLGLGAGNIDRTRMDAILRAAHSIKGGAAMMGYDLLSELSHRMEDFFKVIKVKKEQVVDEELETILLSGVDRLRQITAQYCQQADIDNSWLETQVKPIFERLYDRLGEPDTEDSVEMLSEEAGEDMTVLLFETEVEACLERLQAVLDHPDRPCLLEEFTIAAQEFGGLGEMLELPAFTALCNSVVSELRAAPEKAEVIARAAMNQWRRSQAVIYIGQKSELPRSLELEEATPQASLTIPEEIEELEIDLTTVDNLNLNPYLEAIEEDVNWTTVDLEQQGQELLSSLKSLNIAAEAAEIATIDEPDEALPKTLLPQEEKIDLAKPEIKTAIANEQQTIRVPVEQLDNLGDLFGEITISHNGLNLQLKRLRNFVNLLQSRVASLEKSNFQLRNAYDKVATEVAASSSSQEPEKLQNLLEFSEGFDILEMDRYSELHLLYREVMDTVVQLQEVTTDIEISLDDTDRVARDLKRSSKLMRKTITDLRMRPLSELISAFPRALREMSREYGKKVQLQVRGESTPIERSILENLKEPLLHLFRNAFDHGIENPEIRTAKNKPEIGTITIAAAHRSNQTIITITDDGGGISLEKIRNKALKMGFNPEDLDAVGEGGLLELIFEPGFSTAAKVTDISGRGVGMDVVRTNIRAIEGEIYVDTKEGKGTTFTIVVPFSLSVVRVLLVENEGNLIAFPNSAVEEMVVLEPPMLVEAAGKELVKWEGEMIPLIRLSDWLEYPSRSAPMSVRESVPNIDRPVVLMVANGEDLVAIQFDRYWEEQEVTIRQVEGNLKMPPGFTGCTILGDGTVVPLIDAIGLLRWLDANKNKSPSFKHKLTPKAPELSYRDPSDTDSTPVPDNTVMVVDDSINVRRFLTMVLEKAGYRVEEAKDGQDALDKLLGGLYVKAVICDIEMPVLDGYGFLAKIKSNTAHNSIPVVMLTSRSGEKHRQLALNLGATAYFSKPFREMELIDTIAKSLKN